MQWHNSDLHILDGFVPQMRDLVVGHEFMGIVEDVGPGVRNVKKGDRVVVPWPKKRPRSREQGGLLQ